MRTTGLLKKTISKEDWSTYTQMKETLVKFDCFFFKFLWYLKKINQTYLSPKNKCS